MRIPSLRQNLRSGLVISGMVFCHWLYAGEVNVIVNKSVSLEKINPADLRMIYMAKRSTFPSGEEVVPLDADENSSLYGDFYKGVIQKSREQINSYWSRVLFTGKGRPPQQVSNAGDIIDMVASNRKYIAYVDGKVKSDKVKVVYTLQVP